MIGENFLTSVELLRMFFFTDKLVVHAHTEKHIHIHKIFWLYIPQNFGLLFFITNSRLTMCANHKRLGNAQLHFIVKWAIY